MRFLQSSSRLHSMGITLCSARAGWPLSAPAAALNCRHTDPVGEVVRTHEALPSLWAGPVQATPSIIITMLHPSNTMMTLVSDDGGAHIWR